MRVKEPLNGFRQAQGHLIYHLALLIGSFSASIPLSPEKCNCPYEAEQQHLAGIMNIIRGMHLFLIASQFSSVFLDNAKNDLLTKILRTLEIFFYQGVLLFEQYYISQQASH